MSLFTLLFLVLVILLGIYSFVFLELNETIVHLDLLFLELDSQLGYIILASALLGVLVAICLEFILFLSKKKTKNE